MSSAVTPPAPQARTGPKLGSWTRPDDHLDAVGDHALHDEAGRRVAIGCQLLRHPLGGQVDLVLAVKIQGDRASIALVDEARRDRLHGHRAAELAAAAFTASRAVLTTRCSAIGRP